MDREILFRGKVADEPDEWVQGYLRDADTIFQQTRHKKSKCCDYGFFSVKPETVGQYTGLTDKNGTKIFEGDIILSQEFRDKPYAKKYKSKRLVGVVEYYELKHNNSIQVYDCGYRVKFINGEERSFYNNGAWSDFYDCEVIGNIYDNHELLEGL